MTLQFSKMHGLGNDFMVIDGVRQNLPGELPLPPARLRELADRHTGVGFDQLLLVQPAQSPQVDFRYRIFNANGSEVSQCGNGARCFARFVRDQGLTDKDCIRVETASGEMALQLTEDGQVSVDMGAPRWAPADIPFRADSEADSYVITAAGQGIEIGTVGLGNPHCVLLVEDVDSAPVATLGAELETHADFPERVNVGFMQIINRRQIRLRVYERGAGETRACGSGACAAVLVGQRRGLLDAQVAVALPGGTLSIHYNGSAGVLMTGPASHVYDGRVEI